MFGNNSTGATGFGFSTPPSVNSTTSTPGFTFTSSTSPFGAPFGTSHGATFGGFTTSGFSPAKAAENQGLSSNLIKGENTNCCGICLTTYKSPRILNCKHIFCRSCLTELASKKQNAGEEVIPLTCPLCREKINLPIGGVDKLPMYFEDNDADQDDDDDDAAGTDDVGHAASTEVTADDENVATDVDGVQRDLCVVCENSIPAEYECYQCQKVFCVSCKHIHDNLLKHEMQSLKLLNLAQDICVKHPLIKLDYFCLDCASALCKECVKSEHSLHETQTLKSYLMEIGGELKDYSTNIDKKLETVEMLKVMFISNTESKVAENIENVKKLGADIKLEVEEACRFETENQQKDKTLLKRIKFVGKKILESKRQRKFNQSLIKELQEKIATHEEFYLSNDVDDIINKQIGMIDIQMGRLFEFPIQMNKNAEFYFFFGNLNWTLSVVNDSYVVAQSTNQQRLVQPNSGSFSSSQSLQDLCISLTPFIKPENTRLIKSITTSITLYVEGEDEDATAFRKFTKTFQSKEDQLKWKFKYYGNRASCVKVLFQETNIKHRTQVE